MRSFRASARGAAATLRSVAAACAILSAPWMVGCGGHEARSLKMRTALDAGDGKGAVRAINEELDVKDAKDLPADIKGDNALFVLDRASVQQGLAEFALSKRDFEAADKAVELLDFARGAGDSIGEYIFSGSSGRYQSPPYEKLMINTLNMLNYLETRDLNGARVEARRLTVMQKYYRDSLKKADNPVLGLGSLLAGFTFEKSGEIDEALRYYEEAIGYRSLAGIGPSVARLAEQGSYRGPHIKALMEDPAKAATPANDEGGDVLVVVGYGRVPHKIANRLPIGLVLTAFSDVLSPHDVSAANKLAAQGLVSWINYPTLGPSSGAGAMPLVKVDGSAIDLVSAVDVEKEVREEWKKIEGKIVVSAITRLVARVAVGQGIQTAAGRDNIWGIIASIGTQATLTALDTPDTRSWETLPARIAVQRIHLPAGKHVIDVASRGWSRKAEVDLQKGGWAVVSLMALR